MNEVGLLKQFRHPNIVLFMGLSIDNDAFYIITEYLKNKSLDLLLHNKSIHLSLQDQLNISLDIARAMHYLHSQQPAILHRDIKSSNCLVDANYRVKLGDFGMAKMKLSTVPQTESIATPEYMSPEFIQEQKCLPESDVFSFGILLWEIFAREKPFEGLNPSQIFLAIVNGKRLDIPNHIQQINELSKLIQVCWAQEIYQRPNFLQIIQILNLLKKKFKQKTK